MSLFVQTLSAFTHTLLTPYDTQTLLEELTERVGVVFGLTGSGVMLAVEGHLTLASAVPAAVADLERVQEDEESGPSWDAFRTGIPVTVADLGAHEHGWGRVREEARGLPLFVLAHSHGALIFAGLQLRERQEVAGVVYGSPYLRLAFRAPRLKVAVARVLDRVIPWLPFDNTLDPSQLTHDPEIQAATARDPLYNRTTTPRWYFEMLRAQFIENDRAALGIVAQKARLAGAFQFSD